MAVHVAILLKPYIRLILDGSKTVESRLTVMPKTPYRRIQPGERIYFKASAGPFMAEAVADRVEFHEDLTPAVVERLKKRLNGQVRGDEAYWQWKARSKYATFVWLRDVRATSVGPAIAPSRGPAWFTLSNDMAPPAPSPGNDAKPASTPSFSVELTDGAIRNGYVVVPPKVHRFPPAVYAEESPGVTVQLELPDGQTVETDVIAKRNQFRWRGWRDYFKQARVRAGDRVRFEMVNPRRYRVHLGDGETSVTVSPGAPPLLDMIPLKRLRELIKQARREDMGPKGIDVTSELLIPASATTTAVFRARKPGRLSGAALLPEVIRAYDPTVKLTPVLRDGDELKPGAAIAEVSGKLRSVLALERVALNFLTHLSGIASLTARFVAATEGTGARIYDTRKTHAGLRELEKYAVTCGGGYSHRMGLFDAVLVKDNHIAHLSLEELPSALAEMIRKARGRKPEVAFVMVEVDTLDQLRRVLDVGPDIVLLDNMTPDVIRRAIALRDRESPRVELEVSGGVNLDTVKAYGETGVDRISVGALTHSAVALDIGLDIG